MKAFPSEQGNGMDLRDYFAAMALHGFIKEEFTQPTYEQMAQACYELADAMMKARQESSQSYTK
jgi:hypothetical protein